MIVEIIQFLKYIYLFLKKCVSLHRILKVCSCAYVSGE